MTELTIRLTGMAHGGLAIGRDKDGRAIFVPFALPGETVRVRMTQDRQRFARAELIEVVKPAGDRTPPRCRHFGICGLCHFQHMTYEAQLRTKETVARDQLTRVGGIQNPALRPIVPHPQTYEYRGDCTLFIVETGGLGYWSPGQRRIFPVEACPILRPRLQELLTDLDIDLPELRKLTMRLGDDDEVLVALEIEDVEPPELAVDFPVSVAIVLPDRTAAALIGDPFLSVAIKNRHFQISPGVAFPSSSTAAEMITDAVIELAGLKQQDTILEVNGESGWLTAALSENCDAVLALEPNPDAVADLVRNLDDMANISVFEGTEESVLAELEQRPDAAIFHHGRNLSPAALNWLSRQRPERLILCSEVGIQAKDAKRLAMLGYGLQTAIPLDTQPQTYQIELVSVWIYRR
jgi:23S rRNA (uracil1939-C5)-methyltransferase